MNIIKYIRDLDKLDIVWLEAQASSCGLAKDTAFPKTMLTSKVT